MSLLRKYVKRVAEFAKSPLHKDSAAFVIPKSEAIAAARFVNTRLKAASAGGKVSRGHRWQDQSKLSTDPRAVKMRERRRQQRESQQLE
jgi:hypothetical protein